MYSINIATKIGGHVFATARHSTMTLDKYLALLELLNQKFPASEGFVISATYEPYIEEIRDVAHDLETAKLKRSKEGK